MVHANHNTLRILTPTYRLIYRKLHWDERGGVKTKHGAKYPVNQDKPRRYIGIYRMR